MNRIICKHCGKPGYTALSPFQTKDLAKLRCGYCGKRSGDK